MTSVLCEVDACSSKKTSKQLLTGKKVLHDVCGSVDHSLKLSSVDRMYAVSTWVDGLPGKTKRCMCIPSFIWHH